MKVEYCPTDQMLADFMTKPLRGRLYETHFREPRPRIRRILIRVRRSVLEIENPLLLRNNVIVVWEAVPTHSLHLTKLYVNGTGLGSTVLRVITTFFVLFCDGCDTRELVTCHFWERLHTAGTRIMILYSVHDV